MTQQHPLSIMGVDLSLTSTGVCINGSLSVIKAASRGAERLSVISTSVVQLAQDNNVDIVVIEGYSFASRNSQAHSIGELGGSVRMRLWESGIPYIDVPPTCRAKFATGRGNAAKTEVMSAVSAKTGLVFSGSGADDMCDAWILSEMCCARLGLSAYTWSTVQLSSLDKVDWEPLMSLHKTKENCAQ